MENIQPKEPILAVDLDGTLLRSDMLIESFWSSLSDDWTTPLKSVTALIDGRASLKQKLAQASEIDVATLPYDDDVIAYIKKWRANGGRTALVTASDHTIAAKIARHLDLFDDVHGSDGTTNLKGDRKASTLKDLYGSEGFIYMGNSSADLAIWQHAQKAVTVNASKALQNRANDVNPQVQHLSTTRRSLRPYVKALRPHQWLKNTLIFLPMIVAHQLDSPTFLTTLIAFFAFCLLSSSVYVLNDLLDLAADRVHPRKQKRPLAAGDLPIAHGSAMTVLLTVLGGVLALAVGWHFFLILLGYYLLTAAYSLVFKRKIVVDICILAGLYTTRIIAGGMATGIPLTVWLLAFSIAFFLSLASLKRQAELVDSAQRGKLTASGRGYHVDDLPIISMIAISAGYVSVLILALYINTPSNAVLYSMPEALWAICCILLYWITRAVFITHRGQMHDDPVVFAVTDKTSLICFGLILSFALLGVFG